MVMVDNSRTKRLIGYATDNITVVMDSLGIDYADRGTYYNSSCYVHGGDNGTAFSWSKDFGCWKCFTHGCDDEFGHNVVGLVAGVNKAGRDSAIGFLYKLFSDESGELSVPKDYVGIKRDRAFCQTNLFLNVEDLNSLTHSIYFEHRGFHSDVLAKYRVGECRAGWKGGLNGTTKTANGEDWHGLYRPRAVIPIFDIDNNFVGWNARTLGGEKTKWLPPPGFKRNLNLFNINYAKDAIKETGIAILCEGCLDVLKLVQNGFANVVGLFGVSMSEAQRNLLIKCGANAIIVALDNDENRAGNFGAERIMSRNSTYFDVTNLTNYLPKKDFGEMTDFETRSFYYYKIKPAMEKIDGRQQAKQM
jgi:hypothetical protein